MSDTILDDLYLKLDGYFKTRGFPSRDIIIASPHNIFGTKDKTSYTLMYQALQELKLPYYEFVTFICYKHRNYLLPDISAIRSQITDDYARSQKVFFEDNISVSELEKEWTQC